MDLITVIVLAVGLCFDSFAVSLTCGAAQGNAPRYSFLRLATVLALFQGLMPIAGWCIASGLKAYIETADHWIAFVLLALIGIQMIRESRQGKEGCASLSLKRTLVLGFATSVDALVTGAAMAMATVAIVPHASKYANILLAGGIIAAVTFISSAAGFAAGRTSAKKLGGNAGIAGGIVLILIGIKILAEHLSGN